MALDSLIPVINKLQDVFSATGTSPIDLPQIVVIGSQSSGKSSVLENIVGRDFLPRGSGIVTRRPLILQLVNTAGDMDFNSSSNEPEEWGEFLHKKGVKFTNFDLIREEIVNETDRLTGSNKGIVDKAINLKVFSPNVPNLTLVDLPGITKVPVGDQPSDIEHLIRSMLLHYVSNPRAIILAVTAANTDLANSDALKLAREIDPSCDRTIGVVTKIDLMDRGTNALDVLLGKVIPLKLGFIGVINRSQEDINNNKNITDSLMAEQNFFAKHPAYRSISSRCGTKFLAKTLNNILIAHIRDCLPDLRNKIHTMIQEAQHELQSYGDTIYSSKAGKGALLLHLLSKFSTAYNDAIDGKSDDVSVSELYGGARISYIFHHSFDKGLRSIHAFDGLDDADIRTAIRNATGPRPSLFVPEVSFELLVKRQITRLEDPSLQCVGLAFRELLRVSEQCETPELARFGTLRERLQQVVHDLLRRCLAPTKEMIRNQINCEMAYINTSHPDFIGGSEAVAQTMDFIDESQDAIDRKPAAAPASDGQKGGMFSLFRKDKPVPVEHSSDTLSDVPRSIPQDKPTDRENIETQIIKSLISSYFHIVRKNVQDAVPKAIMCFLVRRSQHDLQSELVSTLYKEELFDELLEENPDVAQRRESTSELLTVLRRAMEILNEVRDFNAFRN